MHVETTCVPHPDAPGTYLLYLELSAGEEAALPRKPVHLVLAVDASSSMGGPRLACALQAARSVADRLGPEDMFCLLAFNRTVKVLFGPGRVDGPAHAAIDAALSQVKPGVGTALSDALDRCHEVLRRVFVREARPHAIVLTDGYPSVGPSDSEQFAAAARKALAEGMVTSAVGVGLDFDEQAVSAIATGGGGRYSFVDKEADIPGALAQHLGDLFAVAIENVTVRLVPAGEVQGATLLHRYPTRVGPEGFVVETGPIGKGNPRRLLFALQATRPPSPVAATLALSPRGGESETNRILAVPLGSCGPVAEEAVRELYRLELATRERRFWEAVHADDRVRANTALAACRRALGLLEKAGAADAELAPDRLRMQDAAAVLEGRLSAEAREAARRRSHHTGISRVTSLGILDPE